MVSRYAPSFTLRLVLAVVWGAIGIAGTVLPQTANAEADIVVVRVEEDWELTVGNPDPALDAPQITCTLSPTGDLDGLHAAIELNHRSQPSFSPGGLQLQVWDGEDLVTSKTLNEDAALSTEGEVIRWTQSISFAGANLVFEVTDGSSTTWGDFGGQGFLKAIVPTALADLNGYHPQTSVENSGIGFASNRVVSLVLKEVRLVTDTGVVLSDSTPRIVHQQ